jgi:NADH-quinone oxidoreductase subunit G
MVIEERDGEMIRSRAQLGVGINSETLCARGRFGYDFIQHPERLTTPLLKRNGKLEPATWDEALAVIRERLKPTDPLKTGGIASARLTNEELYLFQKLFRDLFKSPNLDSSTRWDPLAVKGFVAATGMNSGGVSVFDAMATDCVLIVGSHLSDENPVTDYMVRRMARENNTTVLIASPRAMKLDSSARVSLRHAPGAEKEMLAAATLAIGKYNADKLSGPVGLDSLKKVAAEELLHAAAVNVEEINDLAKHLNDASTIGIFTGTEFLRFPQGTTSLATLVSVLRAIEKEVLIVPILDRSNQRGAWEMGVLPQLGPGYGDPEQTGRGHEEMFEAAERGELESLYIIGEDPLAIHADENFIRSALSRVSFLLVQDIFLTDTAGMADCVLPGAGFAGKEGTFTNQEGRVQSIKRLMPPPGTAHSDLEIIGAVGRLFDEAFTPRTRSFSPVFEEIRKEAAMYRDVSLTFVNQRNETNDLDNRVALVKGSGVTIEVEDFGPKSLEKDEDDTLFTLITGNHLFFSGRLTEKSDILGGLLKEPVVEISEGDVAKLGLSGGEKVSVKGDRHETVLRLKTRRGSKNGVAFIAENSFQDQSQHNQGVAEQKNNHKVHKEHKE